MGTGRRLAVLLLALTLIGVPAAVLRVTCVGASCRSTAAAASTPAPFCVLPADLRSRIDAGTYEGRSPDAMGVAASTPVVSDVGDGVEAQWPSEAAGANAAMDAPLWFLGRGIQRSKIPEGITLDRIAPTLEPLLGLDRPHTHVRTGTEIPGVVKAGTRTPLVLLIVWKGIGSADLDSYFRRVMRQEGQLPSVPTTGLSTVAKFRQLPHVTGVGSSAGTATAGSLPLDPIAVETTIGTGGLPFQHGVTGAEIRNEHGDVVTAFGSRSPQPVIATLGDDLAKATGGRAKIGLIGDQPGDVGLTGDDWYHAVPDSIIDRRQVARAPSSVAVEPFLADGWGADPIPDLLAIALSSSVEAADRVTGAIQEQVLRAVPSATIVVAGTGSLDVRNAVTAPTPPGTDTVAAGGLFVDEGTPAQAAVDALQAETAPDGSPLFADAFASYMVRFGRYC